MSRSRKAVLVGLLVVPIVAGGFVIQERAAVAGSRLFDQVFTIVSERFVDSVDAGTLYEKAARGLVAELKDPYAELYTPKQREAFNTTTGGFYAGIGMSIEPQDGFIVVVKVFPNTPAAEANILPGDRIIGVDSASTRGWRTDQVSGKLKGPPGTRVIAKFSRPGAQEFSVNFTRRVIRIPAVPYAIMLENKTAYIPVLGFNETATDEVALALQRLMAEGAKSVVLDLRANSGGFLEQAITMSNIFLGKGKEIVTVRGRGVPAETHLTQTAALAPGVPLIVLTDGYTASASEIVAGALQDHDRALIVGTTSYGKGLVQGMYPLDGGWAIKLTTARWFTPSGRSIQKERRLTDDGQFVEVHPDSLESDSARKARPKFKSDAGRVIYGGGAITPDVYVPYDTLASAEQKLARSLVARNQDTYLAIAELSYELKSKVKPGFTVTQEMRDDLFRRLQKRGVPVERTDFDAGVRWLDRQLDGRIATLAFGDSTQKRREAPEDVQLRTALELLKKGATQKELLALASSATMAPAAAARKPDKPR
ncbi:MAG TPA: S41 family peptidase [Gemmatimonadaceae bacterium]|nr:S41 family peptidase [Gemmatimonadaceae bacterium]